MNETSKMILTIVIVTIVTAILGYLLGFAGLFAHSMMEIFYYAGLFGGVQVLSLMVASWWKNGRQLPSVSINTPSNSGNNQPQPNTGSGFQA